VKIVIWGLGKSGTSGLFYKILRSLPAGTIALFEPAAYGAPRRLLDRLKALGRGRIAPDVLAKVLPCGPRPVRLADFDDFDRQVLIVRDPRDRLVSDLLYRGYNAGFARDAAAAREFLALLQAKEADPGSVPLLRLVTAFDALEQAAGAASSWLKRYGEDGVTAPLSFHDARPHLLLFHYEDMVEGRFAALEAQLGLPLAGSATVPPALRRVERSKGSGGWRSWFTPADVDVFRPILQPYLDIYYPRADWNLDPSPRLDPEHGSAYAERVINERRGLWKLPLLRTERAMPEPKCRTG
jgi:hypothetical protein